MDGLEAISNDDLTTLADSLGGRVDDVSEETAAAQLRTASSDFADAGDRLGSLLVKPLWYLPVIGRQLRSAAALSDAAETTTAQAAIASAQLEDLLGSDTATGSTRLEAVQAAEDVLSTLQSGIADLDLGPTEGLLPPLADARNRFAGEYDRVTETLDTTTTALVGTQEFLQGPSNYLLLAANNAEMRAGSGMFLQAGSLQVLDGSFSVGDFTATQDLALADPVGNVDPDLESLWGTLKPASEWRNLNLSPRFDKTAPTAAEMWEASGGGRVDGVVSVDIVAITRLLELTGPVTLASGEVIGADTVQNDLLVNQYQELGGDRDARRERLGQVAQAAFAALNDRAVSASDLLDLMRDLGSERHLQMWSSKPLEQAAWVALGTDGSLTEDSMLLSVMNRGGNKLDPYLKVTSTMSATVDGDLRHIVVEVTMDNTAPSDLSNYAGGPYPGSDLAPGEYKGIVALNMPGGAGNITMSGGVPAALGEDGPTRMAATEVRMPPGTGTSTRFEFDLPVSWEEVEVLASARVPPTRWIAGSEAWTDDVTHQVVLDALV